jgi:hypothetical protein
MALMFHVATTENVPAEPDVLSADAKAVLAGCLQRDSSTRSTCNQLLELPFFANAL